MKALSIEFAPRRPRSLWLWALALVFAVVAASQGWRAWSIQRAWLVADQEVLRLAVRAHDYDLAPRDGPDPTKAETRYFADAAAVADLASFPTARVLSALEGALREGVRLTSVELRPGEGAALVGVEYLEPRSLTEFVDELNVGEPRPRWSPLTLRAGTSPSEMKVASLIARWPPRTATWPSGSMSWSRIPRRWHNT